MRHLLAKNPLGSAIKQGPAATLGELITIIRGTASPEKYGYAPEITHVAQAYSTECTISQRAVLRDAVLLVLEQVALSTDTCALDDTVQALRLMGQISWFAEALPHHLRRLDRLWRAATRSGSPEAAAAILLVLAQDGPVQTKEYWLSASEAIGTHATGAIFDGLARLDLLSALQFADQIDDADRRTRLFARVLPRMARNEPHQLLALIESAADPLPNRLRLELLSTLRRYGLIGDEPRRTPLAWRPNPSDTVKFSQIAAAAAAQLERSVTVHDYDMLNQNDADSPAQALFAAYSLGVEGKFPSMVDDIEAMLEEMSQ